jgi:hypothetical protein
MKMIGRYNEKNNSIIIVVIFSFLKILHNIEKSEIEDYVEERQLFLQYKRDKNRYPKFPEWITTPYVLEQASKKIGTKIESKILYNKLRRVYLFPNKYTSIVKKIMAIDENDWSL